MESDRLPRKLIANVYANVAGYSRLTGEDERSSARAKFWTPIKLSEPPPLVSEVDSSCRPRSTNAHPRKRYRILILPNQRVTSPSRLNAD